MAMIPLPERTGDTGRTGSADWADARDASRAFGQRLCTTDAMRTLADAFAGCAPEDAEEAAARAERLFADIGWLERIFDSLLGEMARVPLLDPPLRAGRDRAQAALVLHDGPVAHVALRMERRDAMPDPEKLPVTLVVPGRVTITRHVRPGGVRLLRWHVGTVGPDFTRAAAAPARALPAIVPAPGAVLRCDGRCEGEIAVGGSGCRLALVAEIKAGAAPLARGYRIADGALVQIVSADDAASRSEMLLAYLRHAGRRDAGARFDAATRDRAFHTRWAAMREWLLLDRAAAWPRLTEMAVSDAHPDVRAAAAQTMRRVVHGAPVEHVDRGGAGGCP